MGGTDTEKPIQGESTIGESGLEDYQRSTEIQKDLIKK